MAIIPTRQMGIFVDPQKQRFYTRNLCPGRTVYEERLVYEKGIEYREWNVTRSKFGAGLAKRIAPFALKEGDVVLYLGASTGTTVSHVSDIVGEIGLVFALEFAPRVMRELVFLAERRHNIAPILADANHPEAYRSGLCQCDFLFMDIAQRNQVEIFAKNLIFLKPGGYAMLSLKARSVDVTKKPSFIFEQVRRELEQRKIAVVDYKYLEPFEKDHCLFLCKN